MHISEGILSTPVLVAGAALSLPMVAWGLKKMELSRIPWVAAFSAIFFLASFIHVPLGPTNVHLVLSGVVGALLGWQVFPAMFAALLLQALLFGYGGLTTLGVNILIMAFPAWLVGYGLFVMMPAKMPAKLPRSISYFFIGAFSVLLSTLLMALALALSGEVFVEAAKVALISYIPLSVLEGIIALFLLRYLEKSHPELCQR